VLLLLELVGGRVAAAVALNHRDRVRQIISNARRFQCGGWKGLWEMEGPLRLARRETDTNAKRKHNRAKRDTSSIHARLVYAEHCARRGALSRRLIRL
jgi:hypothetical protein